ncbi:MAG: hypothetical protein EBY09_06865 [Verrucomicrobia bacterium]|nr:hypothetical protein [Verrucomicrobiota bacterium]NDE97836.1 hypothetical protein [Verrucomicrobiota bacterium]
MSNPISDQSRQYELAGADEHHRSAGWAHQFHPLRGALESESLLPHPGRAVIRDSGLGILVGPRHAAGVQILVIGLNPAVDVEWRVTSVHWDEKNVVLGERRWAGGKSVNVARWLRHLGGSVKLLVPLGGATGAELRRQMRAEKVSVRAVAVGEPPHQPDRLQRPEGAAGDQTGLDRIPQVFPSAQRDVRDEMPVRVLERINTPAFRPDKGAAHNPKGEQKVAFLTAIQKEKA